MSLPTILYPVALGPAHCLMSNSYTVNALKQSEQETGALCNLISFWDEQHRFNIIFQYFAAILVFTSGIRHGFDMFRLVSVQATVLCDFWMESGIRQVVHWYFGTGTLQSLW